MIGGRGLEPASPDRVPAVVVAEVALALMLLIGAGLLIRSFVNLQGALGIPLVAGRFFTEQDGGDIEALAIVNTRVARRLWGDQDPVGRALSAFQDMRLRIVGVVAQHARFDRRRRDSEDISSVSSVPGRTASDDAGRSNHDQCNKPGRDHPR